ncbi:P-loop containing nucleoside triphosphate hydrolase protein [Ampelomyces quisqualis]|uniref:P-loop containing nucleoside triphosphate hydrolase protein n=1 Tax=Ampelomyces quisqualis TaxID=50730 RepID=A0A6A5QZ91_AMPQU|nr:P-loop containing nucleoside triphosphate hydrolase protein [Ampelomyces quisqualis]
MEARKLPGVDDGYGTDSVESRVREYITRCYAEITVGQHIPLSAPLVALVDRIEVKGHSKSEAFPDSTRYSLCDSNLEIAVYELHATEDVNTHDIAQDPDCASLPMPFSLCHLPNQAFDGYWEALVYSEPVGEHMLRVLTGAIRKFHNQPTVFIQNAWYNTVLLSGPPGSGKTSLAQALAQRLSIRVSDIFPNSILVQVDGSGVFSHMYGGTAKEIGSLFTKIGQLACDDSDDTRLVVVLVDEIDKLVPCRKSVGKKNEPLDTMRATAEVLTGLDKLRKTLNVVWLFTTNLPEDLDPAFVDRCRLKEHVHAPAANCVYDILRADINAKLRCGEILVGSAPRDGLGEIIGDCTTNGTSENGVPLCAAVDDDNIPSLVWAGKCSPPAEGTAAATLQCIAANACGLSGRNLRGLLDVALFTYFVDETPSLSDALVALERVVQKEARQAGSGRGKSVEMMAQRKLVGQDGDGELPTSNHGACSRPPLPIDTNVYSSDY